MNYNTLKSYIDFIFTVLEKLNYDKSIVDYIKSKLSNIDKLKGNG